MYVINTVKLLYNGHRGDKPYLAAKEEWPLCEDEPTKEGRTGDLPYEKFELSPTMYRNI